MIKNAIITDAEISYADRGCLDCWITVDYGGSGQGFGGFALYLPKGWGHHTIESPAGHHIFRIMEIAGVEQWSKLKGKTIRVRTDSEHDFGGRIVSVGHIVKEDWFCPEEDYAELRKKEN